MIPVEYYSSSYFIVLSGFVLLFGFLRLCIPNNANLDNKSINDFLSLFLLLITILFIGLRDPYGSFKYLGDTRAYTHTYMQIGSINLLQAKDIGFSFFMKMLFKCDISIQLFYLISAFFYVVLPYLAFRRWFRENAFYALLMYVTAMSFWVFGINGLRNGLATSIFIFALSFMDKKWLMFSLMILSVLFHKSMLLMLLIFLVSLYFIKDTKKLCYLWFACNFLCFIIGPEMKDLTMRYLSDIDDKRVSNMVSEDLAAFTSTSFRFDFVLYSAIPIGISWYLIFIKKYEDSFYVILVNIYLLSNSIWILFFMYVPFTNRYAYLSWFLMPIILIYPLLKTTTKDIPYKTIGFFISCNLLFTLIMFLK